MKRLPMLSMTGVFRVIEGERAYQEMRKTRDNGAERHTVAEYLLFMQDYLTEAVHVASRVWGPEADPKTLDVVRKVTALGVACMEDNGAVKRQDFEFTKSAFIPLTRAEIQSGSTRVNWAENLIQQLPATHEGRNSWLLNHGVSAEADALRAAWSAKHGGLPFSMHSGDDGAVQS